MSKASKKAAKMAAKAKKANKKAEETVATTTTTETSTETTVENPPVEEQQPAPAQEQNPPATQETGVEEIKDEKPDKKNKKKGKDKIPEFVPEVVDPDKVVERANKLAQIPIGKSTSSVEGKAMLSYVMWEKYGKNEELKNRYPELYEDLCRNIDFVNFLALVDLKRDTMQRVQNGEFNLTVDIDQIAPLQEMAGMLGVTLTPTKALPGGDKQQLSLQFKEGNPLAEEKPKKSEKEVPELDPSRITDEGGMKKALNYKLCETANMAVNLANAMQWFREYKLFKAKDAEAKLKVDDETVSELVNEMFREVQPTALLKGLGRSIYLYTKRDGSPIVAHTVLHHHLSPLGYSEDAIADLVRCLISEQYRYSLSTDEKIDPKTDKAMLAITSNLGNDYIDQIFNNFAIDQKTTDNEQRELKNRANEIIGRVRTNYIPADKLKSLNDGKTINDAVRMAIGRIINLYRDPADQLVEYTGASYTSPNVGEYPKKTVNVDVQIKKK